MVETLQIETIETILSDETIWKPLLANVSVFAISGYLS